LTLYHGITYTDTCADSLCKPNYDFISISTSKNIISIICQKGRTTVEWKWWRHRTAITRTQGAPKIFCTGPRHCWDHRCGAHRAAFVWRLSVPHTSRK